MGKDRGREGSWLVASIGSVEVVREKYLLASRSGLSSLTLEASNALLSPFGSHRRK